MEKSAKTKKRFTIIIECPERIPCNPCVDVCPKKAITIKDSLINIPKVDYNKCIGCLLCIPKCPGLAIFGINHDYNKKEVLLSIPYEFLPRPKEGTKVWGLDRNGKRICKVTVERVIENPKFNHCAIIQIRVKKKYSDKIRMIKV
ncbi:MAG: 4Fe-4S dicluster domain-containing protein [candidate division WOR-3 bacterium]